PRNRRPESAPTRRAARSFHYDTPPRYGKRREEASDLRYAVISDSSARGSFRSGGEVGRSITMVFSLQWKYLSQRRQSRQILAGKRSEERRVGRDGRCGG